MKAEASSKDGRAERTAPPGGHGAHASCFSSALVREEEAKPETSGSSLVAQWVKDPVLSLQLLGPCSDTGAVLDLGTSTCLGHRQKEKTHKKTPPNLCLFKASIFFFLSVCF